MSQPNDFEFDCDDLLQCLHVYDVLCNPGAANTIYYLTREELRDDMLAHLPDDGERARRAAEYARGKIYHELGYRIYRSQRHPCGYHVEVPETALSWRMVSAGSIALADAERLEWVEQKV